MSTHDYRTREEIIITVKGPGRPDPNDPAKRPKAGLPPPKIDKRFLPRRAPGAPPGYFFEDIRPSTIGVVDPATGDRYQYFPQNITNASLMVGAEFINGRTGAQVFAPGGLMFPIGDFGSFGYGINDNQQAVARQPFPGGGPFDTRAYKFNYVALTLAWLGSPASPGPSHFTEAYRINEAGIAVGSSDPRDIFPAVIGNNSRALKWPGTAAIEIFPGSTATSIAYDINGPGDICGMADYEPFVYKAVDNSMHLLGPLSGIHGTGGLITAQAINNAGHCCGLHTLGDEPNNDGLPVYAFYYDGSTVFNIEGYDGFIPTTSAFPIIGAYDINIHNEIVGSICIGLDEGDNFIFRAFIWNPADGMTLLQDLLQPGSDIILQSAVGINDRGDILAWGYADPLHKFHRRGYFGRKG